MLEDSVSSSPTFWAGLYSWFTPTVFFVVLQLVIGTIYITSTLANNATHKHPHQHQHQEQDPDFHQHQQLARSPSMLQRLKSINFYSYPYRSQDTHTNIQQFQELPQQQHQQPPQLPRSPSLIQRFKSINLYSYFPTETFSSKLEPNDNTISNTTISHQNYEPGKKQQQHVYDPAVVETDEEKEEEDEDQNDVVAQIEYSLIEQEEEGDDVSSMDEIYSKLQGQGDNFTRTQSDTKPASGEVPVKLPKKMKKSASSKSVFSHFKEEDIVENRRPATAREKKVDAAAVDDHEVDAKADDFINKFKQQLKLQRLDSIMGYKEMIGRGSGK